MTTIRRPGSYEVLIGRGVPFSAMAEVPKSLVYLPLKSETVQSITPDGTTPIFVSPTRASAVHLEAARLHLIARGQPPFFDYSHEGVLGHSDRKAGVPTRFWWDPKRGVMVDSEWTLAATQALTGKLPEWDALSPRCAIAKGEAIGLFQNCGGLVNASAMGRESRFRETADFYEMVAGSPDVIAQVDAALRDDETRFAEGEEIERDAWKVEVKELCAKDPLIAPVFAKNQARGKSMAIVRLAQTKPSLLVEQKHEHNRKPVARMGV